MNRREFIKVVGVSAVGLMAGSLPLDAEGRSKRMKIKELNSMRMALGLLSRSDGQKKR